MTSLMTPVLEAIMLFTTSILFTVVYGYNVAREAKAARPISVITNTDLTYVSFSESNLDPSVTIVVDCMHPICKQLTHHLKAKGQRQLLLDEGEHLDDSSTEQVLHAIKFNRLAGFKFVATNHFDVDSFLSVWSCCNPKLANRYESILREASVIGDFRELSLDSADSYTALALVCWLNSEEKRLFYRPFESSISKMSGEEDGDSKFHYFLPIFSEVLANPLKFLDQYRDEYSRVMREYESLQDRGEKATRLYPKASLVVIEADEPLHYYSLFSRTIGYDVVLSIYSGNRYEIEIKYTTYVDLSSRATLPRIEMTSLQDVLNILEKRAAVGGHSETVITYDKNNDQPAASDLSWFANRINDSGPLLRLECATRHLNKMERYGHQYERPIFSSRIDPERFEYIASTYFAYAYKTTEIAAKKYWTWQEYREFNDHIDWEPWRKSVLNYDTPSEN